MGFASWFIDRLPASKRAVRQAREDIAALRDENARLHGELAEALRRLHGDVRSLREDVSAASTRSEVLAWAQYRREGEGDRAARRRLFEAMPAAAGPGRLLQIGCAHLLSEFDALCAREGIRYWALSGTLLGTVRHHGFIPWDDDLDVGLSRADLDRLMALVRDDARFRVTERFDPYVLCRQLRFSYRDPDNPCFIDLFVHDASPLAPEAAYDARCRARAVAVAELSADPRLAGLRAAWDADPAAAQPDAAWALGALERAREGLERGGAVMAGTEEAASLTWAVDNLGGRFPVPASFAVDELLPTVSGTFEGARIALPAAHDRILHCIYGDYLDLPRDIGTHFRHVADGELARPEVIAAIRAALDDAAARAFDEALAAW